MLSKKRGQPRKCGGGYDVVKRNVAAAAANQLKNATSENVNQARRHQAYHLAMKIVASASNRRLAAAAGKGAQSAACESGGSRTCGENCGRERKRRKIMKKKMTLSCRNEERRNLA
jgi:hypothetical protein